MSSEIEYLNEAGEMFLALYEDDLNMGSELTNNSPPLEEGITGYNSLCHAIEYERSKIARVLIRKGVNLNVVSRTPMNTPLHLAVMNRDVEMAKLLVDRGALVNVINSNGCTALHYAATDGMPDMVLLLLRHGADVDVKDNRYRTPLELAIEHGRVHILRPLREYGADIDASNMLALIALSAAASNGYTDIVEWLLAKDLDINDRYIHGETLLDLALKGRCAETAKRLLDLGASVHTVSVCNKYTPLHVASESGLNGIVELLLRKGADVNAVADFKITPIHLALRSGNYETMKLLLNHRANVDTEDKDGKTILHLAVETGDPRIVDEILTRSPDANNNSNKKSLRTAVCGNMGSPNRIVESLLQYGFTVGPGDASDSELFSAAVQRGCLVIVENLLKHGAKVEDGPEVFAIAVKNRSKRMIQLLLDHGFDINAMNKEGNSILHCIAFHGQQFLSKNNNDDDDDLCTVADLTKFLLERGAAVNAEARIGLTPLQLAIQKKHKDIMKILLEHGADYNSKSRNGETAFHIALFHEMEDVCHLLIKLGADVHAEDEIRLKALHLAMKMKCTSILRYLLRREVDVDVKSTLLRSAVNLATGNQEEICGMVLEAGADVNTEASNKCTPLHLAVLIRANRNIIEILLKHGADVNLKNDRGHTPLHCAAAGGGGREEICKLLVQSGADVNATDENGLTALNIAMENEYLDTVYILLRLGADVNSKSAVGLTLLHMAVQKRDYTLCKFLIRRGADVNVKENVEGVTALHLAAQRGLIHIMKILFKSRVVVIDVNPVDNNGNTALHYASDAGEYEAVLTLIKIGSDVNVVNKNGQTATHVVANFGYTCYGFKPKFINRRDKFKIILKLVSKMSIDGLNTRSRCKFEENCKEEIKRMISTRLKNTYISFHDILIKRVDQIASYARNKDVVQAMTPINYMAQFPNYADMIRSRFGKGMERKELLDEGYKFFIGRFNTSYDLPHLGIEKILGYLDNSDLMNLRRDRMFPSDVR